MSVEHVITKLNVSSVKLEWGSVTSGGKFTASDAAAACRGMADVHWQAFCYSYAGHHRYHDYLLESLIRYTRVMAKAGWPDQMQRVRCECHRHANPDYIPDLCELVLMEERQPRAMSELSRASWFGTGERNWHRKVKALYSVPFKEYTRWKYEAEDRIKRNLGGRG